MADFETQDKQGRKKSFVTVDLEKDGIFIGETDSAEPGGGFVYYEDFQAFAEWLKPMMEACAEECESRRPKTRAEMFRKRDDKPVIWVNT